MTLPSHLMGWVRGDCGWSEGVPPLPCSPPFDYHQPPLNTLSFQRDSRFRRLTTFVFIDIPASAVSFPQRPFVFIDIRASFVKFLRVLSCCPPQGVSECGPPRQAAALTGRELALARLGLGHNSRPASSSGRAGVAVPQAGAGLQSGSRYLQPPVNHLYFQQHSRF